MIIRLNLFRSIFAIFLFLIYASSSFGAAKGGCIPGTYLMREAAGAQSLWTFSRDGNVQMASSAQGPLNFSDGHGAWKQTGSRKAKATFLDFNYGQAPPPDAIARVDSELTFSKNCSTVEGSFELRFFDPSAEDPLDPESDTGDPLTDTFTGRRVTPKK
jgi:hypothetical protein